MRRQEYLSLGTTILPWFVLAGFLSGIGLAVYGMAGWASRQKIIDEREDIGLYKERAELRQLTDAEKADKLDRDAKESVTGSPSSSSQRRLVNWTSARTEIAIIESALREKLCEIYPGGPDKVLSSVAVQGNTGQRLEVDAAVTRAPEPPIFFELKYASSTASVFKRIVDGLQQLARVTRAAINASGVLVVIAPDDATPAQVEQWRARAAQMVGESQSIIGVYVGRYSDFIALPAKEFAAQLGLPGSPSN
jgi:hypothetical protein